MERTSFVKNSLMPLGRIGFRLLRHASLLIEICGKKILVDPMLSEKNAMDPIANAPHQWRIPMVDLPLDEQELHDLLESIDAVIITHIHRDHWDQAAQQVISKDTLIFCQPADEAALAVQGFTNLMVVTEQVTWGELTIHRTGGQHGTGEIGRKMGTVSGFVLDDGALRLYIAGDTIWCREVQDAIEKYAPTQIVVNGGGAQFLQGDPITMTIADVLMMATMAKVPVYVVHLETVNHCNQRRQDYSSAVASANLTHQIFIPADGEQIHW